MGRSARLHGAAAEALAVLEETIEPLEGELRDRDCERLREAMGAEAFEAEYAAGRALTPDEVLTLAGAAGPGPVRGYRRTAVDRGGRRERVTARSR
jgi:hypothetical protein